MQAAQQSSQDQADFSHQFTKDIAWRNLPYHADYNPALFTKLERYRSDLNRYYFALLGALDTKQELKSRYLFVQFDKTLSRYLHDNRIQLYSYLEKIYENDDERKTVIEANKMAMNKCVGTITKTLIKYVSPTVIYDEKFRRELSAIWKILKKRHKQEKEQLYPLYPAMLTPNKTM
jgi:hypothetical protein